MREIFQEHTTPWILVNRRSFSRIYRNAKEDILNILHLFLSIIYPGSMIIKII